MSHSKNLTLIRLAILLVATQTIFGCMSVRAYRGQELPDTQTARLRFTTDDDITITAVQLNSEQAALFIISRISVLPGDARYEIQYSALWKRCFPFPDQCTFARSNGVCKGVVTTEPGKSYFVILDKIYPSNDLSDQALFRAIRLTTSEAHDGPYGSFFKRFKTSQIETSACVEESYLTL